MTISMRMQIIIGTVTLVCVLLVGGAFIVFREIGPSPASLLPAERTVILVSHLSPDIQRQWQTVLPSLEQAPLKESGTPIAALVKTGTGKAMWVAFDERGKPLTNTTLIMAGEQSLSSDQEYRKLRGTYTQRSPWMFVRFPETKLNIAGVVMPRQPVSLTLGTGSLKVSWAGYSDGSFTGPIPSSNPSTVFRVSAGHLGSLITTAGNLLTAENRLIAETLLRSWVARIAGPDISAQYDLMPMLDGAGTVIAVDGSGSIRTAVRVLSPASPQDMLTRFEQGALSSGAAADIYQRTFDEKFTFTTVRAGSGAQMLVTNAGGWTTHTIPAAHFISAIRGWEFGMGTDTALLTSLLRTMQSTAVQRTADGVFQSSVVDSLLSKWHIGLSLPWNLIPGTGQTVVWDLESKGGIAELEIKRSN